MVIGYSHQVRNKLIGEINSENIIKTCDLLHFQGIKNIIANCACIGYNFCHWNNKNILKCLIFNINRGRVRYCFIGDILIAFFKAYIYLSCLFASVGKLRTKLLFLNTRGTVFRKVNRI